MSAKFLELASPHCSADDFDGEIVAINLETGVYYSVKGLAALIWHDLLDGHSVEALLEAVRGNEELQAATARYIDELVAAGLMRPSANTKPSSMPARTNAIGASMELPFLEPFGDMQDLLLLDPVHEVDDEMGWPNRPSPTR